MTHTHGVPKKIFFDPNFFEVSAVTIFFNLVNLRVKTTENHITRIYKDTLKVSSKSDIWLLFYSIFKKKPDLHP